MPGEFNGEGGRPLFYILSTGGQPCEAVDDMRWRGRCVRVASKTATPGISVYLPHASTQYCCYLFCALKRVQLLLRYSGVNTLARIPGPCQTIKVICYAALIECLR